MNELIVDLSITLVIFFGIFGFRSYLRKRRAESITYPKFPAYIDLVGAVSLGRHQLTKGELCGIGEFTRENVARWFEKPHQDWENWIGVTPVEDFHAVCGDIDIPWTNEEAKSIWQKAYVRLDWPNCQEFTSRTHCISNREGAPPKEQTDMDGKTRLQLAMLPYTDIKRIATKEEIRQHDEELEIRKLYWHVLFYVDMMSPYDADWHCHMDDMPVVYEHLKHYDVSSACKSPNGHCICSGIGIKRK